MWFERLNQKLHLTTWEGGLLLGAIPTLLLILTSGPFANQSQIDQNAILYIATFILFSQFACYTSVYLRRSVERLVGHANILGSLGSGSASPLRLEGLTSIRRITATWIMLLSFLGPLFILGPGGSLFDNAVAEVPYWPLNFVLATFFWVFFYSMFSIYKIGKRPLKLKPYTEDRTLGLRPFGTASLQFTLVYLGIVTFLSLVIILGGVLPLTTALLVLLFYPLGILFFLLPLRSIHQRLTDAKARELAWLEPRATAVMERLKEGKAFQSDQQLVNELTMVDIVQRDIHQIHTWPFDTSIVVRLVAVMLSLVAILLSAIIRDLFRF